MADFQWPCQMSRGCARMSTRHPTLKRRSRSKMYIVIKQIGIFSAAVIHDDALSVSATRHEAARRKNRQHAVFPRDFSLSASVDMSSYTLRTSTRRKRMAHSWHDSGKPQRRLCVWPSKRRKPTPRVWQTPRPIRASSIWSAFWPVRPRGISSTPRRLAMSRTASPNKEALA